MNPWSFMGIVLAINLLGDYRQHKERQEWIDTLRACKTTQFNGAEEVGMRSCDGEIWNGEWWYCPSDDMPCSRQGAISDEWPSTFEPPPWKDQPL